MTLSNLEIEENVIGSSNFLYTEPEQEYNLIGLRPTIEMPQEPQTIDTTIGPFSLNFNQSCLEPDQVPQNIRQSMSSLPNDSQFPLQPQENQSSMVKEKKKAVCSHQNAADGASAGFGFVSNILRGASISKTYSGKSVSG